MEYSDVRGNHRQPIENSDIWKFLQERTESVYFSISQYIVVHYRILNCAYPIKSILLYTLVYPSISQCIIVYSSISHTLLAYYGIHHHIPVYWSALHSILTVSAHYSIPPYSRKVSWTKCFANFVKKQVFAKVLFVNTR